MQDPCTTDEFQGCTRVTTVLAPFSGLANIPLSVLNNAAERGTVVHRICEGYIMGYGVSIPDQYKGYVDSFLQWYEGKDFLPNPGRLYDKVNMITGECDAIWDSDDGNHLVDFKTSVREGKTWPLQGVAYKNLLELNGISVDRIIFVKLDKNGLEPTVYEYDYEQHEETWARCLKVYRDFFDCKIIPFEEII